MNCAHDHTDLPLHIAHYLHTQGVTLDPMADQTAGGDLPAVFVGPLPDQPDRAVSIVGPWHNETDSPDSTMARFMIVTRSDEWDYPGLIADGQTSFSALHRPNDMFDLTAQQEVFFCERIVSDPPVQDQNRRWVRVDTYQTRLQPPRKKHTIV